MMIELALALVCCAPPAEPQSVIARRLARELMEFLSSRFAREVAEEGVERLEPRVARLIEHAGEDAILALRRVGPRVGMNLLESHGAPAARILARWGDDGARLLSIEGETALRLYARYGDDAVHLMLARPGLGGRLVESLGPEAIRAVRGLGPEGAAELADLAPAVRATGRGREILDVVERFGDRACAFLWRNKGVVFGAALLAAFLSDPEPYLNGAKRLVVEPAREIGTEAARRTDWTAVVVAGLVLAAVAFALRRFARLAAA